MQFHEDIIFKKNGTEHGQNLVEILEIEGKIVKMHQTEYAIIDPKMYKPDFVIELEDRTIILEFQSTRVNVKDKRRFRFYTAIINHVKIKSEKTNRSTCFKHSRKRTNQMVQCQHRSMLSNIHPLPQKL